MMLAPLKTRDYRLLWIGQGISHLGDQFHLIALPWLVLTLTHDPFQLGLVLALAGIPRAAVMLIGGAFADRHSPRMIMLVSDALRFVIAAALAVSILTGTVQLWMVYALALSFGVVSGFFMPAAEASLPRLLKDEQLEGGNALMMGVAQLMSFVGPALAGAVIALFGATQVGAGQAGGLRGIGVALAVDAASFAVSAAMLALMRVAAGARGEPAAIRSPPSPKASGTRGRARSFAGCWGCIAAVNFLVIGPLMVGVPVLAQTRFSQGAAAFGWLMAAYGLGSLAGMVVAGTARRPSSRLFSGLIIALFAGFGVVIALLAAITSVWVGVVLLVVLGVGDGYVGGHHDVRGAAGDAQGDAGEGDEPRHAGHARPDARLDGPRRRHRQARADGTVRRRRRRPARGHSRRRGRPPRLVARRARGHGRRRARGGSRLSGRIACPILPSSRRPGDGGH